MITLQWSYFVMWETTTIKQQRELGQDAYGRQPAPRRNAYNMNIKFIKFQFALPNSPISLRHPSPLIEEEQSNGDRTQILTKTPPSRSRFSPYWSTTVTIWKYIFHILSVSSKKNYTTLPLLNYDPQKKTFSKQTSNFLRLHTNHIVCILQIV